MAHLATHQWQASTLPTAPCMYLNLHYLLKISITLRPGSGKPHNTYAVGTCQEKDKVVTLQERSQARHNGKLMCKWSFQYNNDMT